MMDLLFSLADFVCVCPPSAMNGDSDLIASMAGRLTMVERELLAAKREVLEKDQKIIHLQEKVKLLERVAQRSESESEVVKDLKARCLEYQKQVEEMEVRDRVRTCMMGRWK